MRPRRKEISKTKAPLVVLAEPPEPETAQVVLAELIVLLEDYAPFWYTEALHDRAQRAMAELANKRGFSLIQGRGRRLVN